MRYTKILTMAMIVVLGATTAYADQDYWYRSGNSPEIDLWVNKGDNSNYYYGEDVAVFFRANDDCYVVVYDVDPSGEVNILFPNSYRGSSYVRGGEVYRIPGHDDDFRLEVSGRSGKEHIFAVASYEYINPPDFMRYIGYDYGDNSYYDDDYFVISVRGDLDGFVAGINARITGGSYTVAHTRFFVDTDYRHHRHYRYWDYDPYYVGSVWVGCDWPGAEIWIDGVYFGIGPMLIPRVIVGYHWVWVYYGGYPCYQRYFYVPAYQRFYVDVRIDQRYKDYRYRRSSFRGWVFEEKKYRNESGFKERAREDREKNIRTRSLPPSLIKDYADRGVLSKDAPLAKKVRATAGGDDIRERKGTERSNSKVDREPSNANEREKEINKTRERGSDELSGTDKSNRATDERRIIVPEKREVERPRQEEMKRGDEGSRRTWESDKSSEKKDSDSRREEPRKIEKTKQTGSERGKSEGSVKEPKQSTGNSGKKAEKRESSSSSKKSDKSSERKTRSR